MKPNIEIVANWWFCSLKISYRKDMKVIVGVIWTVIATLFFSLLRDPIQCVRMMVAAKATMVAGSTKYKFLRPRLVESYEEILVIACEEASEWSMSNPRLGVDLTYLKPSSLEERLQKQGMPIHVWIFAFLQ